MVENSLEKVKEEKLKWLRKQRAKKQIQPQIQKETESQETIELNIEIPVYKKLEEVPELEPGNIVYIEKHEKLFVENGQ